MVINTSDSQDELFFLIDLYFLFLDNITSLIENTHHKFIIINPT